MRVLLWSEVFWPHVGGIEVFCAGLIRTLRKRGHEFCVITSQSGPGLAETDAFEGTPVHRFPFHAVLSRKSLGEMANIHRCIAEIKKNFEPQLIHLHTFQPSIFFHLKTKSASAAPSLLTVHAVIPSGFSNAGLLGTLLREVDWINAVSQAALEPVLRLAPTGLAKSSVIHCGLVSSTLRPQPLTFDPPRILCVGRLVAGKGFDRVIDALPVVAEHFPSVELIIAGDGPERGALEGQAAGKARFLGWVSPDDIAGLMNSATVVVMPSREAESFGLVALQAGQMGRPVIASDLGGLSEAVLHGVTGLQLSSPDGPSLGAALVRLLSNPDEARRLGEAARERVNNEFTMERCAVAYEKLYHQLVHGAAKEDGS